MRGDWFFGCPRISVHDRKRQSKNHDSCFACEFCFCYSLKQKRVRFSALYRSTPEGEATRGNENPEQDNRNPEQNRIGFREGLLLPRDGLLARIQKTLSKALSGKAATSTRASSRRRPPEKRQWFETERAGACRYAKGVFIKWSLFRALLHSFGNTQADSFPERPHHPACDQKPLAVDALPKSWFW